MVSRIEINEKLRRVFGGPQAEVLSEVIYEAYHDLVRADDFNELKAIVKDIAVTQQRTEQRMEAFAEAQQRTEQRVEALTEAQQQLAEAQQRTEQRIEALAEAQQRTEQRVGALAEAQQQLAEAQQRTEQRVGALVEVQLQMARTLKQLNTQVGGISNRMGGDLEEVAAIMIHDVMEREFGWQVDKLDSSWHMWNSEDEEVDVFGQAHDPSRPDTTLWIVGEVKFTLTMSEVRRFTRLLDRASRHLEGELVPVLFCYRVSPEVSEEVKKAGYHLIRSNGRMM